MAVSLYLFPKINQIRAPTCCSPVLAVDHTEAAAATTRAMVVAVAAMAVALAVRTSLLGAECLSMPVLRTHGGTSFDWTHTRPQILKVESTNLVLEFGTVGHCRSC